MWEEDDRVYHGIYDEDADTATLVAETAASGPTQRETVQVIREFHPPGPLAGLRRRWGQSHRGRRSG